ncbi:MAG: D-aminoacyl-tRNA deacylase [Treponema sp.]|jgi:D-tyrosyl-tRNA(Tyr) deacylase|nr:D-aminoacyl-tRNA deacylase [Treponema sp.]
MKAVIQRVIDASVTVNGALKGSIAYGLLVYLGVAQDDTTADADWLAEKIAHLRIFNDSEGKMNGSLLEIVNQNNKIVNKNSVNQSNSEVNHIINHNNSKVNDNPIGVLAISQFTLLGDARKGRRPSWGKAAPPEKARELYGYFMEKIREQGLVCASGEFQAHMEVKYTNDGPVTILLDSEDR